MSTILSKLADENAWSSRRWMTFVCVSMVILFLGSFGSSWGQEPPLPKPRPVLGSPLPTPAADYGETNDVPAIFKSFTAEFNNRIYKDWQKTEAYKFAGSVYTLFLVIILVQLAFRYMGRGITL